MALAKKDLEYIEQLKTRIALSWTEKVAPDVPIPTSGLSTGFLFVSGCLQVLPSCSSQSFHAIGKTDKTDSQGARELYSARLLALRAMRNELEENFAARLRAVDQMIEEEVTANAKESSAVLRNL